MLISNSTRPRWGLPSNFGNRKRIVGFEKRAVNRCNPLKFINLAATLYMRACSISHKQFTAKTWAFLKDIQVRFSPLTFGGF